MSTFSVVHPARTLLSAVAATAAAVGLALLITRFDAPPVLALIATLGGLLLLCLAPDLCTLVAVAVLYSNVTVALRSTGVPTQMLALASALFLALPCVYYLFVAGRRLRTGPVFAAMSVFLGVQLVAAIGARDTSLALLTIAGYVGEGLVLYLLVVNVVRDARILHRVFAVVVGVCVLLSSMSIMQAATGHYQWQFGGLAQRQLRHVLAARAAGLPDPNPGSAAVRVDDRASGPIGDPNRYAQILIVALPLAVYLWQQGGSLFRRRLAAAAALTILTGIALTYSRGAFLTLGGIVLLLTAWRHISIRQLAAGVGLLAVAVVTFAPQYQQRMATILRSVALGDDGEGRPDPAIRGRATEMLAAAGAVADHPLLGVGPGQYVPFYSTTYQANPSIAFRPLDRPREAHDLFLSIAAETGLVGLAVFLWILGHLVRRLLAERRFWIHRDAARYQLATACLLSLVGYAGTGIFLHLSYERYFWFLVALIAVALRFGADAEEVDA